MHILVTNDDGPPSHESSPYILPFVRALEHAGHVVSVLVPDRQRSWIGKAHLVGESVLTTPYWPPASDGENTAPVASTAATSQPTPWILASSTPAGCAQLGLHHPFFTPSRGPIDLVISGPNFGRNTTAVFALSSGTLGAALEAAVCGARAIALSFAFFDGAAARSEGGVGRSTENAHAPSQPSAPAAAATATAVESSSTSTPAPVVVHSRHDPAAIAESCRHAVRICEYLATQCPWFDDTVPASLTGSTAPQIYSVNVPMRQGVSTRPVVWTQMLQNTWKQRTGGNGGACFQEIPRAPGPEDSGASATDPWAPRQFKWAPRFADVYDSVARAGPGSDGWAVKEGETSITALRANFMHAHAPAAFEGKVML